MKNIYLNIELGIVKASDVSGSHSAPVTPSELVLNYNIANIQLNFVIPCFELQYCWKHKFLLIQYLALYLVMNQE